MKRFVLYATLLMWISTCTPLLYTYQTIDTFVASISDLSLTFLRLNRSISQSIRCAANCEESDNCIFHYHNAEEKSCYLGTFSGDESTSNNDASMDAFMMTNGNETGYKRIDNQNQCSVGTCLNSGTCIDGYMNYHCDCPQYFNGKHCETVPYNCRDVGEAKHVSAGLAGVWAISENNTVMLRQNDAWINVGNTSLETISSGLIVCGTNVNSTIYCKQGFTSANPEGEEWVQVTDGNLNQVDVNKNGYFWGVNSFGTIYKRANQSSANDTSWLGYGWLFQDGGGIQQVSLGGSGAWVINSNGEVKYRVGTFEDDSSNGSSWQDIDTQGLNDFPQYIESTDGYVWICTANNTVYRRAVSADQPTGDSWEEVPEISYFQKISIESDGKLWGITLEHRVSECLKD